MTRFNPQIDSAGPWPFENESVLAAGDHFSLDLRHMTHRNRPGYFRPFMPLDNLKVTNLDDTSTIEITINNQYGDQVESKQSQVYKDAGITHVKIKNVTPSGLTGSDIAAGDVRAVLSSDKYDADERAYDKKRQHPALKVLGGVFGGI